MPAVGLSQLHKRILRWVIADHQRTQGRITSRHQELVRALQRDKGTISHRLQTLEEQSWVVMSRSSGGKAESLRLTLEGQKRVAQCAGSCDERENTIETRG